MTREEAIMTLRVEYSADVNNNWNEALKMAIKALEQEPKTGHWILTSDDDCEYCTCSECGYQNGENWMIGSVIKFCQECGAKMAEPQLLKYADNDTIMPAT